MHRVDTSTAAPALPAPNPAGTPGYFTQGNPGTGTLATVPGQDFFNAVQEEIIAPITAAGLALDKANRNQLLAALQKLFFSTGDLKLTTKIVADPGWVMMNDGSIGNAASGATARANTDTQALFEHLWNRITNTWCPVQDSLGNPVTRGASATADFNANRRIVLPRALGRALAIAGAGAGLTNRALGEFLGAETHLLGITELPSHNHGGATGNAGGHNHGGATAAAGGHDHGAATGLGGNHSHSLPTAVPQHAGSGFGFTTPGTFDKNNATISGTNAAGDHNHSIPLVADHTHGITAAADHAHSVAAQGGGAAHNNMPPETFVNAMIKL